MIKRALILFFGAAAFLLSSATLSYAQNTGNKYLAYMDYADNPDTLSITVTGIVTDINGPVEGAVITQKGTVNDALPNVVTTDENGKYEIKVIKTSNLIVTNPGFVTQEVLVDGRSEINFILEEEKLTDEAKTTGSVAVVETEKIVESRPLSDVGGALSGTVAGVTVTGGNAPGSDGSQISIRGQSSSAAGPLVIIDGVESTLSSVNPQDVKSMSVLKDASTAALYGSRAANGVIVIETKKGSADSVKITYNGYASVETAPYPTSITPVSNYADYMRYINEGYLNSGMASIYSPSLINEWSYGTDPLLYPNTDYLRSMFQTGIAQNHVLSITGGSEKVSIYGSFGYLNNPGIMQNSGQRKYSGRISVDASPAKWLTMGIQVNGNISNLDMGSGVNLGDFAVTPAMTFQLPDGRFGGTESPEDDPSISANNPIKNLYSVDGKNITNDFNSKFYITLKPFKGFTVTGTYSYQFKDQQVDAQPVYHDLWSYRTNSVVYSEKGSTSVTSSDTKLMRNYADVNAKYSTKFANNRLNFSIMAGASTESNSTQVLGATGYDLISSTLSAVDAATGKKTGTGKTNGWALNSFYGKLSLSWGGKYFLDGNFRADGTSRLAKGNRWGYFPSASFAWRISGEDWMKGTGINNLKLRLSYGQLGSNAVGNYAARSLYGYSNYSLGNEIAIGIAQTVLANEGLTWELSHQANVGLDFAFLKGRFSGSVDVFYKYNQNVLLSLEIPAVHGTTSAPSQNYAEMRNQGVELSLGWSDNIGKFSYNISGNFSYIENTVMKYLGDGYKLSGASYTREGYAMNSLYMLRVDRIIQTEEDMKIVEQMLEANPKAFAAFGTPKYGDLLYKDLNGDGVVDNNDKEVVSHGSSPRFSWGLNLGFGWNGIDFSALIQGTADAKMYWQSPYVNTSSVNYGHAMSLAAAEGAWREGRTDATYPRLSHISETINNQISDFYLQDMSFIKIRNIQIGYTLPTKWISKISLERVRLYFSLENYFSFTKFGGMDPEVGGFGYPNMKQALFGANITFCNKSR